MKHSAPEPQDPAATDSHDPARADLLDDFEQVLFRMGRLMSSRAEHWGDGLELTPPQYMVLKALEHEGPLRVSDVAAHMGVGAPAASMILQALFEDDLVIRDADPSDRRATLVSVSDSGRERMARAEALRRAFMARITERLSTDDLATMIRGLQTLADTVAEDLD